MRGSSVSRHAVSASALLLLLAVSSVRGWGGLFNRFNPSMLSNLGYGGGSYGKDLYGASEKSEAPSLIEEVLEESSSDPCVDKPCTANEHCCEGHVCVDTDEENDRPGYGSCLPIFGKKQGEDCYRDQDCEAGFLCVKEPDTGLRSCQVTSQGTQALGEDCRSSSDCNIGKGLCCMLQRRGRSQPKKICTYFSDPRQCVGHVNEHHVRSSVQHTAGEKRISGHPDYHHLK